MPRWLLPWSLLPLLQTACAAVAQLAGCAAIPSEALEPQLECLLAALLPLLQHQHSRVRLAALEALHSLVLRGLRRQVGTGLAGAPGILRD